jgi:hypothetical protein
MSNATNGSNATSSPRAYVIFIKESMHDEVEMARYKAAVGASVVGKLVQWSARIVLHAERLYLREAGD